MIIVRLIGGLGNQLFQYAAGMSLAKFHDTELKLDITGFENYHLHKYSLDSFKISATIATNDDLKMCKKSYGFFERFGLYKLIPTSFSKKNYHQIEKCFSFDQDFYSFPSNSYLDGYWQSEKYFLPIEKQIRNEFVLKKRLTKNSIHYLHDINSSNSVSVHIRRGDYFSNSITNEIHGVLPIDYYIQSVNHLKAIKKNLTFFIFSDDLAWCEKHLRFNSKTVYVKTSTANNNFYDDFMLMSLCKHHIIANSTFSWWAAWLDNNPDKIIIAPKIWFRSGERDTSDILPSSWVII